jgi:hypothetical protein
MKELYITSRDQQVRVVPKDLREDSDRREALVKVDPEDQGVSRVKMVPLVLPVQKVTMETLDELEDLVLMVEKEIRYVD